MNILMHCVYFPPEVGGLESHVFNLCRGLVTRGHRVDVVTSRSLPDLPARERMDGIHVSRTWFPARNPGGWFLHSMCSTPRATRASARADVVHAQAIASIPPTWIAGRIRNRPVITTLHTSHFLRLAGKTHWRPGLRTLLRASDHTFATSVEIADVADGLLPGLSTEPVTNGVETSVFRRRAPSVKPATGPLLVVPRRLVPKNGVRHFVRAMPAIAAEIPGAEAILVGDGPDRDELGLLSEKLGVARQVRFLGARPHAEMPGILSSATAAVIPSLMEATSVAALEAMACELPVAVSRVGGLPEIVDESVGTLFEPGDPDDLATRVVALLRRSDLSAVGRRARARVAARWSNDLLVERHLEVYRALRAGGSVPRG